MEDGSMNSVTRGIPILEYHDIGDSAAGSKPFHAPYVLPREKFHAQMEWLYNNNYHTITIDDLFTAEDVPAKAFIMTFDDGHISNFTHAFPVLKKYNFTATFFLVSRFIGRPDYISIHHIGEMQKHGMYFGSHTLTHPYLLFLESDEMKKEIFQSKTELQDITGTKIHYFSIPYGFYNHNVITCAQEAGYLSVITEDFGYYRHDSAPFKMLPRIIIKSAISQKKFMGLIDRKKTSLFPMVIEERIIRSAKSVLGPRRYIALKAALLGTDSPKQYS